MSATGKQHGAVIEDVIKGRFQRKESVFRNWIKKDGSTNFAPELDRYHLYVSLACPWAHRTLITRAMKGLEDVFPVTIVHHHMANGWRFVTEDEKDPPPFCLPEPLHGFTSIRDLYFLANPEYNGRFTVPVLWDKKMSTIVNNESSEIIVMLNNEFNDFAKNASLDFYPIEMRKEIDTVAQSFYNTFNNGVRFFVSYCAAISDLDSNSSAFSSTFNAFTQCRCTGVALPQRRKLTMKPLKSWRRQWICWTKNYRRHATCVVPN